MITTRPRTFTIDTSTSFHGRLRVVRTGISHRGSIRLAVPSGPRHTGIVLFSALSCRDSRNSMKPNCPAVDICLSVTRLPAVLSRTRTSTLLPASPGMHNHRPSSSPIGAAARAARAAAAAATAAATALVTVVAVATSPPLTLHSSGIGVLPPSHSGVVGGGSHSGVRRFSHSSSSSGNPSCSGPAHGVTYAASCNLNCSSGTCTSLFVASILTANTSVITPPAPFAQ
ncbi:hypothetical protein B0H16DRAFT_953964 [Mycena metata]|uniref:Uncharacterized protein n=1 Tax=Mycena metata TaxID=1033252 RepID=A0AAD7NVX9_9AGAR|nr:hypothetical protein B0H16DRAFT_953964 [Mycena metata]